MPLGCECTVKMLYDCFFSRYLIWNTKRERKTKNKKSFQTIADIRYTTVNKSQAQSGKTSLEHTHTWTQRMKNFWKKIVHRAYICCLTYLTSPNNSNMKSPSYEERKLFRDLILFKHLSKFNERFISFHMFLANAGEKSDRRVCSFEVWALRLICFLTSTNQFTKLH